MCVRPIRCRPAVQLTRLYSDSDMRPLPMGKLPDMAALIRTTTARSTRSSHSVAGNEFWLDDFCAAASTTTVSKSILVPEGTMGGLCNLSEGSYHGCFSTTPF